MLVCLSDLISNLFLLSLHGAVATREANRSVQRVLDEPSSQQPPAKQLKHTFTSDDQRAKLGIMLRKTETLLLKENSVLSFQHSE